MRVHLFTLCWNEADMLGFFFRHYDPWVERYVVFDDGSTDGSIDRLDAHPRVERRRLDRSETGSFVLSHRAIQNEVWQESRGDADWVVVTALDEHLWCPQTTMAELLARHAEEGVTAVPALGYQMLADDLPPLGELLCTARTIGAPWPMMNKLSLFRPDALAETYFGPGRHTAAPIGDVRYPRRDELLLLHYKYIGFDRLLRRQALLRTGLGEVDHQRRFGHQYSWGEDQTRAHWEEFAAQAVDIAAPGPDHHTTHPGPRWWRAEAARRLRQTNDALRATRALSSDLETALRELYEGLVGVRESLQELAEPHGDGRRAQHGALSGSVGMSAAPESQPSLTTIAETLEEMEGIAAKHSRRKWPQLDPEIVVQGIEQGHIDPALQAELPRHPKWRAGSAPVAPRAAVRGSTHDGARAKAGRGKGGGGKADKRLAKVEAEFAKEKAKRIKLKRQRDHARKRLRAVESSLTWRGRSALSTLAGAVVRRLPHAHDTLRGHARSVSAAARNLPRRLSASNAMP